jgi:hypothetical protein
MRLPSKVYVINSTAKYCLKTASTSSINTRRSSQPDENGDLSPASCLPGAAVHSVKMQFVSLLSKTSDRAVRAMTVALK